MSETATKSAEAHLAITPITETPAHPLKPAQQFDLSPRSLEEALKFADYLADSELVPKDFKGKPGNCLVAIQWGMEIGLKPMQAMQNIAVINGRPSLWGDAVLALVLSSPVCEYVREDYIDGVAYCFAKRRGSSEQIRSFSMADAKQAGLAGKQGPWTQFPKRMQQMRARAFALRDVFPDVLKGLPIAEEVMDYLGEIAGGQPSRQTPTQIASDAQAKPELTEAHAVIIKNLEKIAHDQGFEDFKKQWASLSHEDRTAIGLNERNRIGEIGEKSDAAYNAAETKRLATEGKSHG